MKEALAAFEILILIKDIPKQTHLYKNYYFISKLLHFLYSKNIVKKDSITYLVLEYAENGSLN